MKAYENLFSLKALKLAALGLLISGSAAFGAKVETTAGMCLDDIVAPGFITPVKQSKPVKKIIKPNLYTPSKTISPKAKALTPPATGQALLHPATGQALIPEKYAARKSKIGIGTEDGMNVIDYTNKISDKYCFTLTYGRGSEKNEDVKTYEGNRFGGIAKTIMEKNRQMLSVAFDAYKRFRKNITGRAGAAFYVNDNDITKTVEESIREKSTGLELAKNRDVYQTDESNCSVKLNLGADWNFYKNFALSADSNIGMGSKSTAKVTLGYYFGTKQK